MTLMELKAEVKKHKFVRLEKHPEKNIYVPTVFFPMFFKERGLNPKTSDERYERVENFLKANFRKVLSAAHFVDNGRSKTKVFFDYRLI